MKRRGFLAVVAGVLLFCSCATPHRKTLTSHVIEKFAGRQDGMVAREEWKDQDSGGAVFFFTDPNSQGMCIWHTNQPGIGGGTKFMMAPFSVMVDSNLAPAIAAGGTAVGNVVGAAMKTAVKP